MMVLPEERRFRVALTADFFGADGNVQFKDVGLSVLQAKDAVDIVPNARVPSMCQAGTTAGCASSNPDGSRGLTNLPSRTTRTC